MGISLRHLRVAVTEQDRHLIETDARSDELARERMSERMQGDAPTALLDENGIVESRTLDGLLD